MNNDSTATHVAQVVGAHAGAWTIAFTHLNELLTAISLTLASVYTIYKFISDRKKRRL